MKSVIVRPAAAQDVDDAYLWYESQRRGLGEEFLLAFQSALMRVADRPEACALVHRSARRTLLQRFPYALFYRVYPAAVVVVACMHVRRAPRRWRSRH